MMSNTIKATAASSNSGAEIKFTLIGILGKWLIDFICSTNRIRVLDYEKVKTHFESKRFIFAFWHSRILLITYFFQGMGGAALVSSSDDGEIIARILQRQGHDTIRGSTSRHSVRSLAKMIRALNERDRPGGVVPDGPLGPRFQAQPGIILLAKKTGYPILPVTFSCSRGKVFSSWDRFLLPYPFGRALVKWGSPVVVPPNIDREEEEVYRQRLEDELNRITRAVDSVYGIEGAF